MIKPIKKSQIIRSWHLLDAKDQILGRFASKTAPILIGKNKTYFTRNLDCGDFVVVINAGLIKVTGKKEKEKKYTSYSGYPGGLTTRTFAELKERFPEKIVQKAIRNMLPKNKLTDLWMAKLYVFAGSEHKYADKFNPPSKLKVKSKKSEVKE